MPQRDKRGPKANGQPTEGFAARIVAALQSGPRTPKQIACELFGSYTTPYCAGYVRATGLVEKRVRCEDLSGTARVSVHLAILLKRGEVRRVSKGLYALPEPVACGAV